MRSPDVDVEDSPCCNSGWEIVVLIERVVLSGMLLLIPNRLSFLRIVVAMLFTMLGAVLVLLTMPYRKTCHNYASATTHVGLEVILVGTLLVKLHSRIIQESSSETAESVLTFSSAEPIVAANLFLAALAVAIIVAILVAQLHAEIQQPILLAEDNSLPELHLSPGMLWHLWLSHVWSSGQKQAAAIKHTLLSMLPAIDIFLGNKCSSSRIAFNLTLKPIVVRCGETAKRCVSHMITDCHTHIASSLLVHHLPCPTTRAVPHVMSRV